VPVGSDGATGLDLRSLEEDRIPLKQIGWYAQSLGLDDLARRGTGSGALSSCAVAAGAKPNAPTSANAARFPFAMAQARRIPPLPTPNFFSPLYRAGCVRRDRPP
jgi:hypothetical protein